MGWLSKILAGAWVGSVHNDLVLFNLVPHLPSLFFYLASWLWFCILARQGEIMCLLNKRVLAAARSPELPEERFMNIIHSRPVICHRYHAALCY